MSARQTNVTRGGMDRMQQQLQEQEYSFPYHYIARFGADSFAHFVLDTWAINYASTVEYVLEMVKAEKRDRIVDIGCGDGRLTRELAVANPSATVSGLDYSSRAIALASAMNGDLPNCSFRSMDITVDDPGPEKFDLAILMEVFEHIPPENTARFLASVRKLLHPRGVLMVTVPHQNKPLEPTHFQHFTSESLIAQFAPHFAVQEVVPFERLAWTRRLMEAALSNRWFILRHQRALRSIYRWYGRNLFHCSSERDCARLFVRALAA
jgi:2-polyprenyl-3-methyl-5-hydroxy-6-metoxy-1,4-benzoquinol methylase